MTGGVIDDQMYHITDWADIFISFAGKESDTSPKKLYSLLSIYLPLLCTLMAHQADNGVFIFCWSQTVATHSNLR